MKLSELMKDYTPSQIILMDRGHTSPTVGARGLHTVTAKKNTRRKKIA